jgi:hypothetical protein
MEKKSDAAGSKAHLGEWIRRIVPGLPLRAVHFVRADVFRQEAFRGLVADCILLARERGGVPRIRLLAIFLRRPSRQAEALLEDYRKRFMPELGWLLLDGDGGAVWQVNGEPGRQDASRPSGGGLRLPAVQHASGSLFSANTQWLLKVLLLSGMDPAYWGGPNLSGRWSVGGLASAAGRPQPSVSLFLKKAEQASVIDRRSVSGELVVRNLPALLERWAHELQGRRGQEIWARSIYPDEPAAAVLERMRGSDAVVVSGHAAAHLHGLGVASSRWPLVHVRDLAGALERFDLQIAKADEAGALALCAPRAAEAVFGGAVERDGLRVADLLQVWLDVRLRPDRGQEQAEHLWQQVLAPFFRSRQWL